MLHGNSSVRVNMAEKFNNFNEAWRNKVMKLIMSPNRVEAAKELKRLHDDIKALYKEKGTSKLHA